MEPVITPLDIPRDDRFWDNIHISQSLIQAFREDHCAFAVFNTRVTRTVDGGNENMLRGRYFESKVLGATAGGDTVDDLPRIKGGGKSMDHQRIDQQVENFEKVMKDHNIKFLTKQVKLVFKHKRWKHKLEGTIDAVGTITDENFIEDWLRRQTKDIFKIPGEPEVDYDKIANEMRSMGTPGMFDVKLTRSINRSTGDWSWKSPWNMSATQPAMYSLLMKEVMHKIYPFYYLVFDYSTEMDHTIIRKDLTNLDMSELETDITNTENLIDKYRQKGWDYNPEYYRCKNCPLIEKCPMAITVKPIVQI